MLILLKVEGRWLTALRRKVRGGSNRANQSHRNGSPNKRRSRRQSPNSEARIENEELDFVLLEGEVAEKSESGADERAGHHVAQEMHAQQNARRRDAQRTEEQTDQERWIKQTER